MAQKSRKSAVWIGGLVALVWRPLSVRITMQQEAAEKLGQFGITLMVHAWLMQVL